MLTVAAITLALLSTGCSTIQKVVYRPDINQGNFLTNDEITKLQTGMTKQQVIYLLGTPLLQDPFGSDTWYYVFRQEPGHAGITQQTLTLTFNDSDTLADIKNETPIGGSKD